MFLAIVLFHCVLLFLHLPFTTVNCSNNGVPSIERRILDMYYVQNRKAYVGVEIYNDTLYAIGGNNADTTLKTISYIDIELLLTTSSSSNWDVYTWQSDTSTGVTYSYDGIRVAGSVIVDNLIYITGTTLTEMLVFDVSTNTQKLFNTYNFTMPDSGNTYFSCATTNETHIFVIGGREMTGTYYNSTNKLQIYDILNDEWYYGASMDVRRSNLQCYYDEMNNKIWVTGGARYAQYYAAGWVWGSASTIEYYDISNNEWITINNSELTYKRSAHYGALWTFPYNKIEQLYNNKYGINSTNYSSHVSRFPKYNKQFIYIMNGFNGLTSTDSNWLTENEIFEINNNENNISASRVLPYDGLNDESDSTHPIGATNARWLPSDYDSVNVTITMVNETHEKETIFVEKQFISVGGLRPTSTPIYQNYVFLSTITYEESIFNEIATTNMPSIIPTNIPSNEPTVVPSNIPIVEPTNLPSQIPSAMPSNDPSVNPTKNPSNVPTVEPSVYPSGDPTNSPSNAPSAMPSNDPTIVPSRVPSMIPTIYPTVNPTMDTIEPSKLPSDMPSEIPSMYPSMNPTFPTIMPTEIPLSSTTPETSQETTNNNTDDDDNNALIESEDCKYVKFNCIFGCFLQDNNNNNNNNNNNSIFYFNPGARTVFDLKIEIYLTNTKIINAFKNATANANNNDNNNNSIIVSLSWNVHNNWNDETSKYENVLALLSYNWTINDDTFSIVNTIDEIGNYTNVDILTYDKFTVNIINDSYGIFIIDSNIVLYQSEMDGNMYSYDILYDINKYIDSIFDINKEYRVENEIRLYVNNEVIIENSDNVDLMGNAPISVNNENNNNNNTIYVNCNVEPNSININNNNDSYDLDVSCIFTKMHDLNGTFVNLIFDDSLFLFNEYESLFYLKRQENNTLSKKLRNIPIADGNHSIKLIALDDMDMGTLYYESDTMMFNCVINDNQYNEDTIEMILEIMSSYEPDEQIEFVLTANTAYELIMELGNTTLEQEFVDLVINFTMYNSKNDYFVIESNEVNGLLSLLHTITETSTSTIDTNMDVLLLLESSLDKYDNNSNNIVISESSADLLISILYNVMNNLMMVTSYSSVVIDNEQRDEVGDLITSIVVKLGNLILLNGIVGEYYYFDEYMPLFEMKFAKIDENNFKECQINGNIDLYYANTLLDLKSNNGSNNINCIIMNTQCNIYNLTSNDNFHSNFILFELMNDNSTETNDDNGINAYDLPSCEPVLLSFNVTNDTWFNDADNSGHYPLCSFYNESREMYDSNGCYLLYNDSSRYVCACSHLTFFGLSSQDFEIEINYKPIYIISEWKLSLVFEYPFGMYVSLGWVLLMLLIVFLYLQCRNEIGQCMVLKEDRPLVLVAGASHGQKQMDYGDYRSVNDYSIIADSNMNLFEKSCYLAFNSLKNDHLWFGVCCRNHGSNYTTIERLFVLMLRVLITMAVSSLFYGITGSSTFNNWFLIFFESLLSKSPIFGIKYCIRKSKPDSIENDCENETRTPLSPRKDEKKSVNTMASETEMMATIVNSKNNNNNNDSNDNGATMTQANGEIVIKLKEEEEEEGNNDKYEIAGAMTTTENENENENNMDMRNKVMNKEYPLNKNFKCFAYCLIVLFSIICVIIVSIWCAYFDVSWKYKNNYQNEIDSSQCIDNDYIDISNKVWLNYNSTNDYIDKLLCDNNDYNTTKSFLLEMLISHLVASLFWAPMIALLYRGVYKLFKKQGKQSGDGDDDTINEGKMYYQYQQKLKGKHTIN